MQNDEFNKEDIDDEKTIEYIRQRLPQDLKDKFSDDEFYYFLDTIYDYYDKSGIFESQADPNGYIEIDIEAFFVVEGELAYCGAIDEDEE